MHPYWFDLDGTLIDTKAALIEAYKFAGVIAPESKLHLPWHTWCTELEHDRKNNSYEYFLRRLGETLPLFRYAVDNQSVILTGASFKAVSAVQLAFNVILNVRTLSADIDTKARVLNLATASGVTGTYVDDNADHRHDLQVKTTWRIISPREAEDELL